MPLCPAGCWARHSPFLQEPLRKSTRLSMPRLPRLSSGCVCIMAGGRHKRRTPTTAPCKKRGRKTEKQFSSSTVRLPRTKDGRQNFQRNFVLPHDSNDSERPELQPCPRLITKTQTYGWKTFNSVFSPVKRKRLITAAFQRGAHRSFIDTKTPKTKNGSPTLTFLADRFRVFPGVTIECEVIKL